MAHLMRDRLPKLKAIQLSRFDQRPHLALVGSIKTLCGEQITTETSLAITFNQSGCGRCRSRAVLLGLVCQSCGALLLQEHGVPGLCDDCSRAAWEGEG
jgi:hypothetical protein